MPTGHVFIATSLDGFIARPDDGLDWLMSQDGGGADTGFAAFMDGVDGLLMGAGTFRTVARFDPWPYDKPVVVLSRSLASHDVPAALRNSVEVMSCTPRAAMAVLEERGWSRVYVDGGQLVQACLRDGLIEDIVLTVAPILIGEGKRLFGPLAHDLPLTRLSTRALGPGFVQTHYRIGRAG